MWRREVNMFLSVLVYYVHEQLWSGKVQTAEVGEDTDWRGLDFLLDHHFDGQGCKILS